MAKRYQRGNQKTGIKETHTIQWPKEIPKRQSEDRNQRKTYNTMAKRYQRGNQKTGINYVYSQSLSNYFAFQYFGFERYVPGGGYSRNVLSALI
jgi:hypothetical protein